MSTAARNFTVRCACRSVTLETFGAPIVSTSCYCNSCQAAGRQIEELPSAPAVLDPDGGTPYIVYRKDRVICLTGAEHLAERRLKPESPTRRVVATCCNSAMFLDFTKGHWLSIYRGRFPQDAPALEMRVMTGHAPGGIPVDVPHYRGQSGKFMWRLLASRLAMLASRAPHFSTSPPDR
jgi:hypothetical protein